MSIDVVHIPADGRGPELPGPAHDLIVIYGGWGGAQDGGGPLPAGQPGQRSGTQDILADLRDAFRPPAHRVRILALHGSLIDGDEGVEFFRQNFHPRGRVVFFGYSAGGSNALGLCHQIQNNMRYYGFPSRLFYGFDVSQIQASPEFIGRVRVDLLITVDVAVGPGSRMANRSVPACVRRNLNLYQTTASTMGSFGGPNTADDAASTVVENVDLSPSTEHDNIDEAVRSRVVAAIQGALGRVVDTADTRIGTLHPTNRVPARYLGERTGPGRGTGIAPSRRRREMRS